MTRVKRGTISMKRRRNVLKRVKGYRFGRSSKERQAKEAIRHAGVHAFTHRRDKKGVFRRLWQTQIGATLKATNSSYSRFLGAAKKNNLGLNRKMLAELAEHNPESFKRVIDQTQ